MARRRSRPPPRRPSVPVRPDRLSGAAVVGSTRGSGGSSGDGGPMAGLGMVLGAVTNPNPFLAWLVASAGGVMLYLFLLRRSRDEDPDGSAELLMAAPAVASAGPVARRRPDARRRSRRHRRSRSEPKSKGKAKPVAGIAATGASIADPAADGSAAGRTGRQPARWPPRSRQRRNEPRRPRRARTARRSSASPRPRTSSATPSRTGTFGSARRPTRFGRASSAAWIGATRSS